MKKAFILLVVALFLSQGFIVQPAYSRQRPKIGLVLGGGGARGAAHLGVLKVLKENSIPIDYIAGTSMGSIVGAGYASGMTPEEIEELFGEVDWKDIFNDRPSRENLSFRDKQDRRRLANFEVGFKDGKLRLPQGIVAGQKLDFLLRSLTLPAGDIEHFDELNIPFRAIATDIETGETVTLEDGVLSEAVRASMAYPGAFSPVEIEDRLLFDGMVAKNIPVDVVQDMGADVIIAVDVGAPLMKRDELDSFLALAGQMMAIFTKKNEHEQLSLLDDDDVLINPDLGQMSPADFRNVMSAIKIGEEAAREVVDKLRRYSLSDSEYAKYIEMQSGREMPEVDIDFVKVNPTERVDSRQITSRIETQPGTKLDIDKLQKDLNRVYAIGDFEKVDFSIVKEDGRTGILIDPKEKTWGPHYIRFGLNITDDFGGQNNYTALVDVITKQINDLGGEWRTTVGVGSELGFRTSFYQPVDFADRFFVEPVFEYARRLSDIYDGSNKIAEYRVKNTLGGADVGVNFGTFAQARAGIFARSLDAETIVGQRGSPALQTDEVAFHGAAIFDSVDNENFPHNGFLAEVNVVVPREFLGSDRDYGKIEWKTLKPVTFGKHTLFIRTKGGAKLDDELPFYNEFTLGGFLDLSGYKSKQLRGQYKTYGSLGYYYKIFDIGKPVLDAIYVGGAAEAGNVWESWSDVDIEDMLAGGTVFVGADCIVGPVYFGYGLADEGIDDGEFYLFIGRTF